MGIRTKPKTNLENRDSVESSKIWNLEQNNNPIIDVGDITSLDSRFVNNYPNGQNLTLRDNNQTLVSVCIIDGKIFKGNSTYTEA